MKQLLLLLLCINFSHAIGLVDSGKVKIYVMEQGMHTLIIVPVQNHLVDWDSLVDFRDLNGNKEMFSYLGFGWGEKRYYIKSAREGGVNLGVGARALFWPTSSVMKVDGFPSLTEGPKVIALYVTEAQYLKIYRHIVCSFQVDEKGRFKKVAEGRDGNDAFYLSIGRYTIFNTSNHWTARGLRRAGIKMPMAPITSGPIMRILRKNYSR